MPDFAASRRFGSIGANRRSWKRRLCCRSNAAVEGAIIKKLVLGAGLALAVVNPAFADDVTDQIEEALKAYEAGDLGTAEAALGAASQLIRQRSASRLSRFLPEPLSGWEAEPPQVGAVAMFGGGTAASRLYSRGDETIEISIALNSPMLQPTATMLANPAIAGAVGKLLVVDGRKVLFLRDAGAVQAVVDNGSAPALVQVIGSDGTPEDLLRDWLEAIDLDGLEAAL